MAASDLTGKHKVRAQNVSHSNIKTKRWQRLNVQSRRLFVPELGRFVRLNVTTRDLRSIDRLGFWGFLTKTLDRRMNAFKSPKDAAGMRELFKKLGIEVVFESGEHFEGDGHDHAGHDHAGHDHAH
ncbi:MAG: 50S ribosomal protein L28 [Polyangiales bacterium]